MIDVERKSRIIKRRFDEIFLVDPKNITREDDFLYFIKRIADFYEYLNNSVPECVRFLDTQATLVDDKLAKDFEIVDTFFLKISPIVDKLVKIPEFMGIVEKGKKEFEAHINTGVYSPSVNEIIYQAFDWKLKVLATDEPKQKLTIDQARDVLVNFNRIIWELRELQKAEWIPDNEKLEEEAQSVIKTLDQAEVKVNRYFEYARISSFRQVQNIWKHIYDDEVGFSVISMQIHLIKENLRSYSAGEKVQAQRQCDEYRIDVFRFYHSVLDWLEEQNFIEEAFLDFKIWAEIINNPYFKKLYSRMTQTNVHQKEKQLKDEFAAYLFSSYKIFSFKEPSLEIKRPDSLLFQRGKKIVTEAKIILDDVTQANVTDAVEQGLKQLESYSHIMPHIDASVLIIFNYSKKVEIVEDIILYKFTSKPFFVLPININATPSKSKSLKFTLDDLKKCIEKLGLK